VTPIEEIGIIGARRCTAPSHSPGGHGRTVREAQENASMGCSRSRHARRQAFYFGYVIGRPPPEARPFLPPPLPRPMQDAITPTSIISPDVQGLYLDDSSIERLEQYFASRKNSRVRAGRNNWFQRFRRSSRKPFAKTLLYSDITRPGGNHVKRPSLRRLHRDHRLLTSANAT